MSREAMPRVRASPIATLLIRRDSNQCLGKIMRLEHFVERPLVEGIKMKKLKRRTLYTVV